MTYSISKRLFDFILALLGLFLFFPLILIITLFIFLEDGLPIFYVKKTVGKNGETLNVLKFRSMYKGSENVTRVGRILRQTAMDELPQLCSILKGEMSFVGPRPYGVNKYNSENKIFLQRLSVKPGLTGLAQVFVPKHATDEEVLKRDLEYINKKNFWLDLYIIFISVWITLKGSWESTVKKL